MNPDTKVFPSQCPVPHPTDADNSSYIHTSIRALIFTLHVSNRHSKRVIERILTNISAAFLLLKKMQYLFLLLKKRQYLSPGNAIELLSVNPEPGPPHSILVADGFQSKVTKQSLLKYL